MLPVEKRPSYLSPSSLKQIEHEPNKFYLTRMAPDPWPKDPQNIAAAVGSSFDVMIKNYLINKKPGVLDSFPEKEEVFKRLLDGCYDEQDRNKYSEMNFFDAFFEMSVEEQHRNEAKGAGLKICRFYVEILPMLKTQFADVEIHRNFTLFNQFVPLFMKLDANVKDRNILIPHDWKVMGYSSQASPKPGYAYIVGEDGVLKPPHAKYREDIPFDEIDVDWASQLATYGWGMGKVPGMPFMAQIHAIVLRETGMRIAVYYGEITAEFQKQLIARYKKAWDSINDGSFVRSLGPDRCLVEATAMNERWY